MAGARLGLTVRGGCLVAAGVTAWVCGVLLGETDLARVGVLSLAAPLVALAVVRRSRVTLASRREVRPARARAGEAVVVTLEITNRSLLRTGALMIEDALPAQLGGHARFVLDGLANRAQRTATYRLSGLGRGRYRVGPARVRLGDPFGLVEVRRSFVAVNEFVIMPVVEPLPPVDPPHSAELGTDAGSHWVGAHGADDASIREYRTGDPLRKVHWRATARASRLMVRQEERPWQGSATVLLDLRAGAHRATDRPGPEADPRQCESIEWAVSAAASIGTQLLLAGRPVVLVSEPAGGVARPVSVSQWQELLAEVRPTGARTLVGAGGSLPNVTEDGALIAVLGRLDGESLQALAVHGARSGVLAPTAVLLDTATWAAGAPPGVTEECSAAAQALREAGWRVVVARRGDTVPGVWPLLARKRDGVSAPFRGATP